MASTYLNKTFSTPTNNKIWTWSGWVKKSTTSTSQALFAAGADGNNQSEIKFLSDNIHVFQDTSGVNSFQVKTNAVYRDTSAWYHIVVAVDTTQATASNRLKIYVNGNQETSLALSTYPSLNFDGFLNSNIAHYIGKRSWTATYYDGSMAHVHFIDGTQYAASDFGETDATTGIWKPKTAPSVTYGTNGFFLKFENSGSMGTDSSGNANNFTVNGTMTQTIDTPSNVFATINILQNYNSQLISEGNTKFITTSNSASHKQIGTTFGVVTGKWYWEVKGAVAGNDAGVGISSESVLNNPSNLTGGDAHMGDDPESWGYFSTTGNIVNNNSSSAYGDSWNTEIIGVALDLDNGKLYFSKSGTWQNSGDPESGATGTGAVSITSGLLYFPATSGYDNGHGVLFNFGNGYFGTTAVSSAQNPDDGIGIFEYSVPTGYKALCTKSINAQEYD